MPKQAIPTKITVSSIIASADDDKIEQIHLKTIQPSKSGCERQVFLHLSEHSADMTSKRNPAMDVYANLGYTVEDMILRKISKQGRLIAPLSPEKQDQIWINVKQLSLNGKLDGLVRMPNEEGKDEIFCLEIKSCGQLPSHIEEHHRPQIELYAAIVGMPFIALYVSRTPPVFDYEKSLREFYYRPTKEESIARLAKMFAADMSLKISVLPPRPFENDKGKICSYCPFKQICWDGTIDELYKDQTQAQVDQISESANIWATDYYKSAESRRRVFLAKYGIDIPNKT